MNISELTTGIIEGQISRLQEADEPVQIEYEIEPEIYAEVDENCYRKMLLICWRIPLIIAGRLD